MVPVRRGGRHAAVWRAAELGEGGALPPGPRAASTSTLLPAGVTSGSIRRLFRPLACAALTLNLSGEPAIALPLSVNTTENLPARESDWQASYWPMLSSRGMTCSVCGRASEAERATPDMVIVARMSCGSSSSSTHAQALPKRSRSCTSIIRRVPARSVSPWNSKALTSADVSALGPSGLTSRGRGKKEATSSRVGSASGPASARGSRRQTTCTAKTPRDAGT